MEFIAAAPLTDGLSVLLLDTPRVSDHREHWAVLDRSSIRKCLPSVEPNSASLHLLPWVLVPDLGLGEVSPRDPRSSIEGQLARLS